MSSVLPTSGSSKPKGPQDSLPAEIEGFTEEERQEITSQIDKIAQGNSIGRSEIFTQIKPEKKGNVFPLVVNLLAVIVIAAGVYLTNYYFNQRMEQLNIEARTFEGAEGQILEEVKREAERKIQQKESEINRIREDLSQIEAQRQALQATMQDQIAAKEQELQSQLEAALQAEKDRLESAGISEEELEAQLNSFRTAQEQQYQASLEEFRSESMEQLRQKEQELSEAKATAERILQDANRERGELLEESRRREEELQEQFQAEKERLTQQTSETQAELQKLEDARRNEQLFRDQINGLYLDIQGSIDAGNSEAARDKIDELRTLLQSPSVRNVPSLAKRLDVDSYMIDLLESEAAGASAQRSDESLLEAAKMVTSLRAAVNEAQTLQEEGKLYEARRYYNQALGMMPAVQTAMTESKKIRIVEEATGIEDLIVEGDQAVSGGDTDRAIELYTNAAVEASTDHSGLNRTATKKILQLMQQELAENRQRNTGLSRRIDQLEQEVAEARSTADELEEESSETVTSLNESNQEKDTRIATLQESVQEKEQEIRTLRSDLSELEDERVRLVAQYREAELKVRKLNTELDDAVDQITDLITTSESNRRLRDAVERYQQFEERSSSLISSGGTENREAALNEFERFILSSEVREIFPELPQLYEQLQ